MLHTQIHTLKSSRHAKSELRWPSNRIDYSMNTILITQNVCPCWDSIEKERRDESSQSLLSFLFSSLKMLETLPDTNSNMILLQFFPLVYLILVHPPTNLRREHRTSLQLYLILSCLRCYFVWSYRLTFLTCRMTLLTLLMR